MKRLLVISIVTSYLGATGTWIWNNRTHGELDWVTIETENFKIHYHQGLSEIAMQGASIAEQVRPVLMKQMNLETLPKLDIVLTSEDEVLNGFAVPANYTIIWVDQNDAALWTGDEKWLRTVLAHELQHLVYFNTIKGPWWLPEPMNTLSSRVPAWFVEGVAEYYTEKWRPFRYEISHRGHVMRNTVHKIQDPHNDGFSKSLYLADRFGDSTIAKILNHRNQYKLLDFKESFKKNTGITVKQFNEDWRRHMNTFYFGHRSQKEVLNDVGIVSKLPIKRVAAFDYFPDSMRLAIVGKLSKGQYDYSLIVATRDTAKENKIKSRRLKKAKKSGENPKRVRSKWKTKELDYGRFGEININLDVSPDGKTIVYPKYGYAKEQSLGYDIWKVDLKSKEKSILTSSMRANYPKFSPDGKSICFVAHKNSTSQLYTMDLDGKEIKQITSNKGDVQIITPEWSPDGRSIVFAMSGTDSWMDLYILDIVSGELKPVTNSIESDAFPIWHPDGSKISFTGFYDYTPNLYTYDISTNNIIQNTDLWNMYKGIAWNKRLGTISSMTLNTTDSSRIIDIDPSRAITPTEVSMNPEFSAWQIKSPDNPLIDINSKKPVKIIDKEAYRFFKNLRHLGTFLLPDNQGLIYNGAFTDALGRHTFGAAMYTDYDTLNSVFFQYQNSTGFPIDGFWGFDIYHDANFQLQFFNNEKSYLEVFNGVSLWTRVPYNFGKSQSINHIFSSALTLVKRESFFKVNVPEKTIFDEPDEGKEGTLNISYLFLNKRPHERNMLSPKQGYGLKISLKHANSSIWGNFDYTKIEGDIFINKNIGPFILFGRGRLEAMNGNPPNQEKLAIVDIPNYYLLGATTPGREYMSPRGFSGTPRFGTRAFMGTVEFRLPVIPVSIVEVVKVLKLGSPTFALISDFGNTFESTQKNQEMIATFGYEFRIALNIDNIPIFILSYGYAQEKKLWQEGNAPNNYFQFTLINPF